jgi:hypothetical protein
MTCFNAVLKYFPRNQILVELYISYSLFLNSSSFSLNSSPYWEKCFVWESTEQEVYSYNQKEFGMQKGKPISWYFYQWKFVRVTGVHCFISHNKTNKCTYVQCVYHQHVSFAITTIIRAVYKSIRNPNILSKCISELLDITKNVSNPLFLHWTSAHLLLKSIKIHFL